MHDRVRFIKNFITSNLGSVGLVHTGLKYNSILGVVAEMAVFQTQPTQIWLKIQIRSNSNEM